MASVAPSALKTAKAETGQTSYYSYDYVLHSYFVRLLEILIGHVKYFVRANH